MRLVKPSSQAAAAAGGGLRSDRLFTSSSRRPSLIDLERVASALDYALEQVCLAMNADSSTIRRLADEKLRHALAEGDCLRDQLENENHYLRREVAALQGASLIVGASEALRQAIDEVTQVAATGATVLLLGETGSGKELFAAQIHDLSPRRNRPMIAVNCSAIPSALIESELFGREKGAYTGALSRQAGRFELADKSTLFLDEIGDLPLDVQIKLLRVLQERRVERLGSAKSIPVDVRIIAATNRDLENGIAQGTFREDLYYRLNVFPIRVPPLRERLDDVPLLVWSFVDEFSKAYGKRIESVSKDSMLALQRYPWPGNVRELRNIVERAVIVAAGPRLSIDPPKPSVAVGSARSSLALAEVERAHILAVLERAKWRVRGAAGAAELLDLKPSTLESRMAKLKIRRPGR
jgi:transcriptional regulator with GAF, ATPase, and Fis domain